MQSNDMGPYISSQFNLELEDIHDKILAMGGLVEQQFKFAIQAFVNCETELAEKVIRQITQVDDYEIAINRACSEILARHQPEAFDVKLLIVIIKTITDLQRIGHSSVHIAKRAIQSCSIGKRSEEYHEVLHMYDITKDMLHQALEIYSSLKKDYVLEVVGQENTINNEYTLICEQLLARMTQDTHSIKHALNVLFTIREIERIADKAVLICKNVFYLLEGKNS